MLPSYYWKALHMPSGEYLCNNSSGTTLHTSFQGNKFQSSQQLREFITNSKPKLVKGPQIISFDKEDFQLQKYRVQITQTELL